MNEKLTRSMEDYLEVLYIMQERNSFVRITDIANFLSFSKASVNRAINILKEKNMVIQEKYGKVFLTEKGILQAESIYDKHKILRDFFENVLQVSKKTAQIDACKAEHVLSCETIESMKKFLNK